MANILHRLPGSRRLTALAWAASLCTAAALAGCGGQGAGGGGSAATSGTTPVALEIFSEKGELKASGADETALQILVKDAGNRPVPGQVVTLTADSGVVATDTVATNGQGVVTGKLSISAGDRANRTIRLTATVGTLKTLLDMPVTGTRLTASADKSALVIGETVKITATLEDDLQVPLANEDITLSSALGNAVPASARTDSKGRIEVSFQVTKAGANELITVDAPRVRPSPAGAVALQIADPSVTETLRVTGPQTIAIDPPVTAQPVTIRLSRPNGDIANKELKVTTTRGTIVDTGSPVRTDASGVATVQLRPGTSVGQVLVTAEMRNPVSGLFDGTGLRGQFNATFITQLPSDFDLQANPNSVSLNVSGGGTQRSEIKVRVYDATTNRNPVTGAFVRFRLLNDPSGGSLLSGGATTGTDGFASTTYIAGDRESGTDQVVVEATVEGVAAPKTATLTVAGSPLFVSIGSGNTLTDTGDKTTYQKDFNVRVTDSAGVAVKDVPVTVRLLPRYYVKGRHWWNGLLWTNGPMLVGSPPVSVRQRAQCANEDLNFDGSINPTGGPAGGTEDLNGDGRLWPGQVAAARPRLNEAVRTDDTGSVKVSITYARSFAYWAAFEVQVSAQVGGSQGRATTPFLLVGAPEDFSSETTPPPGRDSPYGTYIAPNPTDPDPCTIPD
ncbi:MAG: hypothetical protein RJA99_3008 [Pseudomonadota bacterium]|jgi:hypothetical protein